jgi:anti-sigma factor RsiW
MHTPQPDDRRPEGLRQAANCPPLDDLARYLDGCCAEDERDRIDLHLAQCPACMELVRDIRADAGETDAMIFVPPQVIERAMALVANDVSQDMQPRLAGRMPLIVVLRRGAAIAASIAIGALGYQIGGSMTPSQHAAASVKATASDDVFFGLIDSGDQNQMSNELFGFDLGETSS